MSGTRILSDRLLRLLRCPICGGALRADGDVFECAGCRTRHPTVGGVPALFDPSRSLFRAEGIDPDKPSRSSTLRRLAHRFLPTLERNAAADRNHARFAELIHEESPEPLVLNIGGKHEAAALKPLWSDGLVNCIQIDVVPGNVTNLIGDPRRLPLTDECVDAVIIDAVLEHVVDPAEVVSEIHRVLKPRGVVYSDSPFMIQVHAGAYDFYRFTHVGHRRLFSGFEEIDSGPSQGPGVALAYSLQYFGLSFVRTQSARFAVKALSRLLFFWLKYLDAYLVTRPGAMDAALGFYFVGRKTERPVPDRDVLETYRGITPDLYRR